MSKEQALNSLKTYYNRAEQLAEIYDNVYMDAASSESTDDVEEVMQYLVSKRMQLTEYQYNQMYDQLLEIMRHFLHKEEELL